MTNQILNKIRGDKCPDCKAETSIKLDIGFDIWEEGELHQHLQICNKCKTFRFVDVRVPFDEDYKTTLDWSDWQTYHEDALPGLGI